MTEEELKDLIKAKKPSTKKELRAKAKKAREKEADAIQKAPSHRRRKKEAQ